MRYNDTGKIEAQWVGVGFSKGRQGVKPQCEVKKSTTAGAVFVIDLVARLKTSRRTKRMLS